MTALLLRFLSIGGLALLFLHHVFVFLSLPENPLVYVQLHITLPVLAAAAVLARRLTGRDRPEGLAARLGLAAAVFFALAFFLVMVLAFTQAEFGVSDPYVLITFLRGFSPAVDVPLGLALHGAALLTHVASYLAIAGSCLWLARRDRLFALTLPPVALFLLSSIPGMSRPTDDHLLVDPVRDLPNPVILSRPDAPRNLLIYYFEGMELAFGAAPSTAEGFRPVLDLARGGLWLRGIHQLPGTEYSAAGYVATQCGVPLVPKGRQSRIWDTTPDSIRRFGFMPAVDCLSDILARDGYATSFVNGADLSTFAIREFLNTHSFDRVIDLHAPPPGAAPGRDNAWGLDDTTTGRWLIEELRRLSGAGRPFLLAYENIGTHGPSGFPDAACRQAHGDRQGLALAVECGVRHLTGFLQTARAEGLLDNTLVLVVSDHLMLHSELSQELEAAPGPRVNLAFLIGPGIAPRQIAREGSMMDLYPTLLEVMGYGIKGGKAGLGRSLLGPEPTLVERFGLARAEAALSYNPFLKRHLWRPDCPPPEPQEADMPAAPCLPPHHHGHHHGHPPPP